MDISPVPMGANDPSCKIPAEHDLEMTLPWVEFGLTLLTLLTDGPSSGRVPSLFNLPSSWPKLTNPNKKFNDLATAQPDPTY